jgi:hypothetical protein
MIERKTQGTYWSVSDSRQNRGDLDFRFLPGRCESVKQQESTCDVGAALEQQKSEVYARQQQCDYWSVCVAGGRLPLGCRTTRA